MAKRSSNIRLGINLIQETTTIRLRENARKPPRRILKRLHILDIHHEHIAGLRGLDVEGSAEIVDAGEVYVADIVGRVVVFDLSTGPVDALDLDGFVVLD